METDAVAPANEIRHNNIKYTHTTLSVTSKNKIMCRQMDFEKCGKQCTIIDHTAERSQLTLSASRKRPQRTIESVTVAHR